MLLTLPALLADARSRTGLEDLHLAGLGDRLSNLLDYMRDSMNLPEVGRQAAHDTVLDLLVSRSRMLEDRKQIAGLTDVKIERPIFVTGLPRSGTTLLHSILAADPEAQSPKWWEVLHPSPPPGLVEPNCVAKQAVDRDIEGFISLQPDLLKSHPYFDEGGETLMECEAFATTNFMRILRAVYWRVPGVLPMSFSQTGSAEFYEYHRMVLQSLQWGRPQKRWALKGTEHHTCLENLKAVYPDAIVIWLHRDPQKVFPSIMALLSNVAQGTSRTEINRPEFGRYVLGNYRDMLDRAMKSPLLEHPDVYHLRYADFTTNPVGSVGEIYERYGIPFEQHQSFAMTEWMADPAHRGDRHGKFSYSLSDFAMDKDELETFAAAYRNKFAIPFE